MLSRLPETKAVFTRSDGSPYQAGDTLTQPALAETLRMVADQGADYMYTGPWAEKLVEMVGDIDGRMTLEDLANYEVVWSRPARGSYHGFDMYAHGSPAEGGVGLIEAMNLAELAGVSDHGHYGDSPEALFWLTQISRPGLTFAVGGKQAADGIAAMIGADLTHETRVRKETSAKLWGAIQDGSFPGVVVPEGTVAHSDAVVCHRPVGQHRRGRALHQHGELGHHGHIRGRRLDPGLGDLSAGHDGPDRAQGAACPTPPTRA